MGMQRWMAGELEDQTRKGRGEISEERKEGRVKVQVMLTAGALFPRPWPHAKGRRQRQ